MTTDRRATAKRETREALIVAALAEFAERGLDAPSLDAICLRAGYTRGAFYVHFRDRDDLMVAVMEYALRAFIDAVIATGDEAHDLAHTVERFADAVAVALAGRQDPTLPGLPLPAAVPFARVLDGITRSPRLREGFAALLQGAIARLATNTARGQHAGTVRGDVDAKQVAFLLSMVALGVIAALDAQIPINAKAASAAVLALLSPPGTARSAAAAHPDESSGSRTRASKRHALTRSSAGRGKPATRR